MARAATLHLRSVTVVVPQHSTESLSAWDLTLIATDFAAPLDDLVVEPTVIPLGVTPGRVRLTASPKERAEKAGLDTGYCTPAEDVPASYGGNSGLFRHAPAGCALTRRRFEY